MDREDPIAQFFPGQEDVNLYEVLELEKGASGEQIKKAYRRLALKYHPDKQTTATEEAKAGASVRFQQVGFTYAVLSDEKRKKRYDSTGRTDEGFELGPGEDGWGAYFEDLFDRVTRQRLDEMKLSYQNSQEEKDDLKKAYLEANGDLAEILCHIPHSTFDDESRFVLIISELIKNKDLKATAKWKASSKDGKAKLIRKKQTDKEAAEAEELAKELGVWEEFYGNGKRRSKQSSSSRSAKEGEQKVEDTSALQALILKKKKNLDGFFDNLAAKYAGPELDEASQGKGKGRGKGKKRAREGDQEEVTDVGTPKKRKAYKIGGVPPPPDIDDEEFKRLQDSLSSKKPHPKEVPIPTSKKTTRASGHKPK